LIDGFLELSIVGESLESVLGAIDGALLGSIDEFTRVEPLGAVEGTLDCDVAGV